MIWWWKFKPQKKEKECGICKSAFMAGPRVKYCGMKCQTEAHRRRNIKYREEKKKSSVTYSTSQCGYCLRSFEPLNSIHRFCSGICRSRKRDKQRQSDRAKDRLTDPFVECNQCKKPFRQAWPRHTALTCGKKCSKKYNNTGTYARNKEKFLNEHGSEAWLQYRQKLDELAKFRRQARKQRARIC